MKTRICSKPAQIRQSCFYSAKLYYWLCCFLYNVHTVGIYVGIFLTSMCKNCWFSCKLHSSTYSASWGRTVFVFLWLECCTLVPQVVSSIPMVGRRVKSHFLRFSSVRNERWFRSSDRTLKPWRSSSSLLQNHVRGRSRAAPNFWWRVHRAAQKIRRWAWPLTSFHQ